MRDWSLFDPTATGTITGTLTVSDDAGGSPQAVSLSGTGQDFAVAPSGQTTATVAPGQTATYAVAVTPGGGFNQTVGLSCSGAPTQSTCSVSPSLIALNGSSPSTAAVTVITRGSIAVLKQPPRGEYGLWTFSGLLGFAMFVSLSDRSHDRRRRPLCGLALPSLLAMGAAMSACSSGTNGNTGGGSAGTQAGTYNLTVTGTFTSGSTTLAHNTKLTLVVQ